MNFLKTEKVVRCPFDPHHIVDRHRLALHIARCWRNHPDADVLRCPFNATHVVKRPHFKAHLAECPDAAQAERDIYRRQNEFQEPMQNQQEGASAVPPLSDEEDWDSETVDSTYNPADNARYKPHTRPPPAGLSKAARCAWRDLEVQRVRRIKENRPIEDLIEREGNIYANPANFGEVPENTESVIVLENGTFAAAPRDSSLVRQSDQPVRRLIAAGIGPNIVSGNMDNASNSVVEDQQNANVRSAEYKRIIKQKRILEKRLLEIIKLENKVKKGHQPTNEEKTKIGRKQDTEFQLSELLEGLHLEEGN